MGYLRANFKIQSLTMTEQILKTNTVTIYFPEPMHGLMEVNAPQRSALNARPNNEYYMFAAPVELSPEFFLESSMPNKSRLTCFVSGTILIYNFIFTQKPHLI